MKYVYPAVFEKAEEGGYNVSVPDIKGCYTCADTLAEAIEMAEDCIEMMLVTIEDEKKPVPEASGLKEIEAKTDAVVSLVRADTDEWRRQFSTRSVKKTLTIPMWLNAKAEDNNINFSQTLQEALCRKLGVSFANA